MKKQEKIQILVEALLSNSSALVRVGLGDLTYKQLAMRLLGGGKKNTKKSR